MPRSSKRKAVISSNGTATENKQVTAASKAKKRKRASKAAAVVKTTTKKRKKPATVDAVPADTVDQDNGAPDKAWMFDDSDSDSGFDSDEQPLNTEQLKELQSIASAKGASVKVLEKKLTETSASKTETKTSGNVRPGYELDPLKGKS